MTPARKLDEHELHDILLKWERAKFILETSDAIDSLKSFISSAIQKARLEACEEMGKAIMVDVVEDVSEGDKGWNACREELKEKIDAYIDKIRRE